MHRLIGLVLATCLAMTADEALARRYSAVIVDVQDDGAHAIDRIP